MPSSGLTPYILKALRALAEASPEREICGLIGRDQGGQCRIYAVANAATEPSSQFLLDARGQIAALREMREQGQELHAIYHSHPHGPAHPSDRDRALAAYPGVRYLIIALQGGAATQVRGYTYDGSDFIPLDLPWEPGN